MDSLFPNVISKGQKAVVLAPMVRAGSLALRSLALDFGCDLVWSEELIDFKLAETRRVVNEDLQTIDYLVDYPSKTVVFFRTHACEKGRVILQLGTGSPESALKAAKMVEADVAGIDVNMGCPKKFSIQGGMGAALLQNQDVACDIIRTLSSNLSIPVTAKIRIINSVAETIQFIKKLEEAGVSAVTVHLRTKGDGETKEAQGWEIMRQIVDGGVKVPILANGDMYTKSRIDEMVQKGGCAGVMLARPFLFNPSMLRPDDFPFDHSAIMKSFVQACLKYDIVHQVAKYTLMEMMVNRRHPPPILAKLDKAGRFCTGSPHWNAISAAKSTKEICEVLDMQNEYTAIYGDGPAASMKNSKAGAKRSADHQSNGGNEGGKAQKKRKESNTLSHPSHFDDKYFAPKDNATSADVVMPLDSEKGIEIIVADSSHAAEIVAVTNDAYVADKFFKKPAYYERFTLEDVEGMQKHEKSRFLVARHVGDNAIAGSVYLTVTSTHDTETNITTIDGNFGAVAVSRKYEKRGIGKTLIEAAATFTRRCSKEERKCKENVKTILSMGVINQREDLFGWYGRQGFIRGKEIRPVNEELERICLPELDICLILMHKDLD